MEEALLTRVPHPREVPLQFDVRMQCPRCKTDLIGLSCMQCGLRMWTSNGIVHALPPERAAHFARFMQDYEHIRAVEGRGSESREFYLGLPYKDSSGRNSGQWHIRARSYDCLINHILKGPGRRRTVLDIGAGNCWMSFRLAQLGKPGDHRKHDSNIAKSAHSENRSKLHLENVGTLKAEPDRAAPEKRVNLRRQVRVAQKLVSA